MCRHLKDLYNFEKYLKDEISCVADGFDVGGRVREGPYISALSNWV